MPNLILPRNRLKEIIKEELQYILLLESIKSDLIDQYPDFSRRIEKLPSKFIKWLASRFLEGSKIQEIHPIEEVLDTIDRFIPRENSIRAKYKAPWFKKEVETQFPDKKWQNPADITLMTSDEMDLMSRLSTQKKPKFQTGKADVSKEEYLGKFGDWNLWMPFTRESSCEIAGYDPVTRKPDTTWCTARMGGSNLFYNYTARGGQNIILFYIIKDNPSEENDWLSVGYIDGKPALNSNFGGVTVNRENKGMNEKELRVILGDQFNPLFAKMNQTSEKFEEKHPAKQKIEKALETLEGARSLFNGLGKEERSDLAETIVGKQNYGKWAFHSKVKDPKVRFFIYDMLDEESIQGYPQKKQRLILGDPASTVSDLIRYIKNSYGKDIRRSAQDYMRSDLIELFADKIADRINNENRPLSKEEGDLIKALFKKQISIVRQYDDMVFKRTGKKGTGFSDAGSMFLDELKYHMIGSGSKIQRKQNEPVDFIVNLIKDAEKVYQIPLASLTSGNDNFSLSIPARAFEKFAEIQNYALLKSLVKRINNARDPLGGQPAGEKFGEFKSVDLSKVLMRILRTTVFSRNFRFKKALSEDEGKLFYLILASPESNEKIVNYLANIVSSMGGYIEPQEEMYEGIAKKLISNKLISNESKAALYDAYPQLKNN